jgi:TonB family protein
MRRVAVTVLAVVVACGGEPEPRDGAPATVPADVDVPVALNADSPFGYPPALYEARIEGDVVLRLHVDATGRLLPESTRIAEPSGHAALDSAALAGVTGLRFAPATRRGVPIGTTFLQPVQFRRPETGAAPAALPESTDAPAR